MSEFVRLQGYAVPFNLVDGGDNYHEFVDPSAFDDFVASKARVRLVYASHEETAFEACDRINLRVDSFGLAFSARVYQEKWRRIRPGIMGPAAECNRCSVHFSALEREAERLPDGSSAMRVVRAKIDHVACTASPFYSATGVWLDEATNLPPRLERLAAKWRSGEAVARVRQLAGSRPAAQSSPRVPAQLAAMLAPRLAEFADLREALVMQAMHNRGAVFSHLAFTKAAGFDGNWSRLKNAAFSRVWGRR